TGRQQPTRLSGLKKSQHATPKAFVFGHFFTSHRRHQERRTSLMMTGADQRASLVERDKRFVWHPYTPMLQYREAGRPLVIDSASGSRLLDLDGRSIIDGNASWWTSLLGHNHPRLVERLRVQSQK